MILDGLLQFTGTPGLVSSDSPTTGTQNCTNVIDLLNSRDMGIGDDPALKVLVEVTTAFTVGTSLQIEFQGAVDSSGSPGSWITFASGPVIAEANLIIGAQIAGFDVPKSPVGVAVPRFLRIRYVTVGTHSTGAVYGGIVLDRQENLIYPAGITVSN